MFTRFVCATKNNVSYLDAVETRSSEESYSQQYTHHDDESTLESCSDIIGQDISWEATQNCEPGIEASLSMFELEVHNSNVQEPPIKELHQLVNIMSEKEKSEEPMQDLPDYKIRRSIATKVMAKKVSKGYVLLEELCTLCDMPLMEGKGKKECKVCPAIRKWMDKHPPNTEEPASTAEILRDLCDEADKLCNDTKVVLLLDDDVSDDKTSEEASDIDQYMTPDIRARINALSPIPEASAALEANCPDTPTENANQLKSIKDRATQIITEARNKEGWVDSSLRSGVVHDAEYYQEVAEARAELIIQRARESLRRDTEDGISSLTPRSKLRNEHRAWLSSKTCKMRSWDAAVIIQSFARMVPLRIAFLEHQSEKRTLLYRELLGCKLGPVKVDVTFEARSEEEEHMGDKYATSYERSQTDPDGHADNNDPEGEILSSPSAALEHEEFDCAGDSENRFFAEQGMEILRIDDQGGNPTPKAVTVLSSPSAALEHEEFDCAGASGNRFFAEQGMEILRIDDQGGNTTPKAVTAEVNIVSTTIPVAVPVGNADDDPSIQAANSSSSSRKIPHPNNRNAFEKVACSFDDAVTKAVSNMKDLVKCTGGDTKLEEAIGIGMGHYKSVSIAAPSSDGTYFHESKRKAASYNIMYRTSLGWKIANSSCALCQMPMMIRPDDHEVLCVMCDEIDAAGNATVISMLPSTDTQHQTSKPLASAAIPGGKTKPIDPDDDSVAPSVLTSTTGRGKPIDPEPVCELELPSYVKSKKTHPYTSTYKDQQWMLTDLNCPRCGMQMSKNVLNHCCRSCGMTVYPAPPNFGAGPVPMHNTSPIISLLDADINAGSTCEVNSFSQAHQMMILSSRSMDNHAQQIMILSPRSMDSSHHGMIAIPSQHQSYTRPNCAPQVAAPHGFGQHVPPFLHYHLLRPMQRAPNHWLTNAPTPNVHRMKRSDDPQHINDDLEVKENSYGQANLSHEEVRLTAVEEAKLRMQNAQNALKRTHLHY